MTTHVDRIMSGGEKSATLEEIFRAMEGFGHPDFKAETAVETLELMGYDRDSEVILYEVNE